MKDGTKLTSISNETLYVTRTEDDVQINGVKIEGNAIKAGNSYVYVVPEVIPMIEAPVTYKHQTTIKVNLIDGEYKPLDGVSIAAKNGDTGMELGTFTTDATGAAVISHNCDTLTYTISKEGYSDLSDGFLLVGMEDGNLSYADLNGDGRIDEGDKVSGKPYTYFLNYKNYTESHLTDTCYMIAVSEAETTLAEWNNVLKGYNNELLNIEMQLITGYGDSPYESDESMKSLANIYYASASKTLETGEKLLNGLGDNSTEKQTIQLGIYRIKVDLYAYFGTMFKSGSNFISADESKDLLVSILTQYKETCSSGELKNETSFLLAKVHLLATEYAKAYENIQSAIPNGYSDIEGKLILAISAKDINRQEAITTLNSVRGFFDWLAPIQSLDGNELIETCHAGLNGNGNLYPYYRVLNEAINYIQVVTGFTMPKHHLLPIPQSVIDESNEVIKQNNGYN